MPRLLILVVLVIACCAGEVHAQSTNASLTGYVTDPTKAIVVGAKIIVINVATSIRYEAITNGVGSYDVTNLPPGPYRIEVEKPGFKTVVKSDVILHVQDTAAINFEMALGSASEIVTVTAGGLVINTTDASVSTVVDRQFAENLPLNGRSFQTLIELTPGVVVTAANANDQGQFSVNGQRANSNYFTIDGVSANVGMTGLGAGGLGQMGGPSLPGLSVLGSTNTLVSVDAMQEFRIQTSTYAAEFGRTPGAQVSIVTRSGTNQFHGTAFEYLRNDILDANDWFSDLNGLPKSEERINDFGGVLGGPIVKNKTFFFFSYEGQRLRLPQTGITSVPSLAARQSAPATIQPYLNAFPLSNGADLGNGEAAFIAGFSDPATLNATSVRIDHSLSSTLGIFGRYSYAPSEIRQRGNGLSLNNVVATQAGAQTFTAGVVWNPKNEFSNDLRFNYSRNRAESRGFLDSFGGAKIPSDSILFPSGFSSNNAGYNFFIIEGQQVDWFQGLVADNVQRQINIVDVSTIVKRTHTIKLGFDYLRLSPVFAPSKYFVNPLFFDVPSVVAGNSFFSIVQANRGGTFVFNNASAFAQDTWRITPRTTLTYGVRWELEPPPSTSSGPDFLAVTGFGSPATLAVAPSGTPLWRTRYSNFAPRLGLAYQLTNSANFQSVLRGGFGVFYDLATQQIGAAIGGAAFPFGAQKFLFGPSFPLSGTDAQPPPITSTPPVSRLIAFDPNLKLPYTLQYDVAFEQELGRQQALSISYVGAVGRRLLQQGLLENPNPNISQAAVILNAATSDYNALQIQFNRHLSAGLQALVSYTWAHSIDEASSDSGVGGNQFSTSIDPRVNRGPSDFDIRHSIAAGVTYAFPEPSRNAALRAIFGGWATDSLVLGRTAPPLNVQSPLTLLDGVPASIRPDVIPGEPLYLTGSQCAVLIPPICPGGKGLNPAAFINPPVDPVTGQPTRQGTLGRNELRGFGAFQWDFAFHRRFKLWESVGLEFSVDFFNVLNHPNFGNLNGTVGAPFFGESTQMLGRSLGTGGGDGSFTQLYQIGGPRSVQLGLKLQF